MRGQLTTTPERSSLMSRVRQRNTAPEQVVQKLLRQHGHLFTTNTQGIPGTPDIVDQRRKRAIFVHGCYWHRHAGCPACTTPKKNAAFWQAKFDANVARDRRKERQLRRLGYSVMTVWECQTKRPQMRTRLEKRLDRFFTREDR